MSEDRVWNLTGLHAPDGGVLSIVSLGVLLFTLYSAYVSVNELYLQGPVWLSPLGIVLVTVLTAGLIYGGYWLHGSGFNSEEGWRVTIWVLAGLLGGLALTFWPILYQRIVGVTVEDPIFILIVSAGLGANAGLVAGIGQLRSERRFRQVLQARDSLEFLNRLLRHNILNAINIIQGNADEIIDGARRDDTVDRARAISRRSDQISELVGNTRILINRIGSDPELRPVNLSAVVSDEVEMARTNYPGAVFDSDIAPDVEVQADDLVAIVVSNLISNAVVHNDRETARVEVTLAARDGSAVLRIADNGPGIPEERKAEVADPGSHGDRGLGLYLVDTLVEEYGGRLALNDNSPRGTVATVEFPL